MTGIWDIYVQKFESKKNSINITNVYENAFLFDAPIPRTQF